MTEPTERRAGRGDAGYGGGSVKHNYLPSCPARPHRSGRTRPRSDPEPKEVRTW